MPDETLIQQSTTSNSAVVGNTTPLSFITDRKQLAYPEVFEQFKQIVEGSIEFDNREEALKARMLLEDILIGKYPELKTESPELYEKYQKLIVLLKFECLSSRPFAEIENLIKNHLTDAIKAKIPIQEKFQDVLNVYDDVREEGAIAESLANIMLRSFVTVGSNPLTIADKNVPPSIGNWLLDYDRNTRKAGPILETRGAIERITYINQNQTVRKLSNTDRKLLLIILELYDWLKYGTAFEEATVDFQQVVKNQNIPVAPRPRTPPRPPTPSHGQDLEVLRRQMGETGISKQISDSSKQTLVKMTPEEIKREVKTPELVSPPRNADPESSSGVSVSQKRDPEMNSGLRISKPVPLPTKFLPSSVAPENYYRPASVKLTPSKSLNDIQIVDDLKKVDLSYLRAGTLQAQISNLQSRIIYLAQANRLLPYYVVNAFEQSPLFKIYLQIGSAMIHDNNADRTVVFKNAANKAGSDLTLQEFEAIADLRKEIERL